MELAKANQFISLINWLSKKQKKKLGNNYSKVWHAGYSKISLRSLILVESFPLQTSVFSVKMGRNIKIASRDQKIIYAYIFL